MSTETSRPAAQTPDQRGDHAVSRDENARKRDLSAEQRDRAAEQRDVSATTFDQEGARTPAPSKRGRQRDGAMQVRAASDREHAEADRGAAASDRAAATDDRAAATDDRHEARAELRHAQLDTLTGAYGRELGTIALEQEINRARHGNGRLVLAFVDVDGLKQVNDGQGHAAGDALLRDVVGAIQTHLRSYDPIVRFGGDEFVCALADSTTEQAHYRFKLIRSAIEQLHPHASVSVGFATLLPEDTLELLMRRGDNALYEAKHTK